MTKTNRYLRIDEIIGRYPKFAEILNDRKRDEAAVEIARKAGMREALEVPHSEIRDRLQKVREEDVTGR